MIGFFLARDDSWMMMMWLCWCYSTSCCCCWPRQVWKVLRTSLPLQAKTICSSLSPISPHLDPNVYLTEQLHHTACLIYFLLHALVLCTCWVYSTQVMPSFGSSGKRSAQGNSIRRPNKWPYRIQRVKQRVNCSRYMLCFLYAFKRSNMTFQNACSRQP
jgi:hypothetical protein